MANPARIRRWLLLLLLFLGGSTAAVAWLQSEDAFQRLWLPLTARLAGGAWSAERGRLELGGSLELEGLRFELPELAEGEIARLRVVLRPWASLRRGGLQIALLELDGGDVELDGGDLELASGPRPDAMDGEPGVEATASRTRWPAIDHAEIEGLRIRRGLAGRRLLLGPLVARVDELDLPAHGHLALEAPFDRQSGEGSVRGRVEFSLQVTVPTSDGDQSAFSGDLDLGVAPPDQEPVHLSLRTAGKCSATAVELDHLELEVLAEGHPLLALRGSGSAWPEPDLALHLLASDVERLRQPWTHPAPTSLTGRVTGDVRVGGRIQALVVEPDLTLEGLRVRDRPSAALPEPLQITGRLRWLQRERTLHLEPLGIGGPAPHGLGRLAIEGTLRPGSQAQLTLTAQGLDAMPWLGLLAEAQPSPRVRAQVDGTAQLQRIGRRATSTAQFALRVLPSADPDEPGTPLLADIRVQRTVEETGPREEGELRLRGPGAGAVPGQASFQGHREVADHGVQTTLRGEIASLDATALVRIWRSLRSAGEEPADTPPAAARETSEPAASRAEHLDLQLSIGALQLGELGIRGGTIRARYDGEGAELQVDRLGLAGGRVQLDAGRAPAAGGERVAWDLVAQDLDLAPLVAVLAPDGTHRVSGLLSLESRAEGVAALGEDPATAPSGRVRFRVRQGRVQGLGIQQVLARAAEIAQFAVIDYDEMEGDYAIEKGRVLIDELRLDGTSVHLVATGEVSARGVDLILSPRIGPNLKSALPRNLLGRLFRTASDLLALPLVVSVEGPWARLEVGVRPAAPSLLQGRFGDLVELLSAPGPADPPASPPHAPQAHPTP